ncbi:hypothetical protein IWZ01DRAFT_310544 [Phyllosticta capitalensis]
MQCLGVKWMAGLWFSVILWLRKEHCNDARLPFSFFLVLSIFTFSRESSLIRLPLIHESSLGAPSPVPNSKDFSTEARPIPVIQQGCSTIRATSAHMQGSEEMSAALVDRSQPWCLHLGAGSITDRLGSISWPSSLSGTNQTGASEKALVQRAKRRKGLLPPCRPARCCSQRHAYFQPCLNCFLAIFWGYSSTSNCTATLAFSILYHPTYCSVARHLRIDTRKDSDASK